MASEVNRQNISAEDFYLLSCSYPRNLLTLPSVCAAFFLTGLQPQGCTKQLIRVKAGRSFAWTCRLQASLPAPSKIMRSPRRLFKASRSRCQQRSPFRVSDAIAAKLRSQIRKLLRFPDAIQDEPSTSVGVLEVPGIGTKLYEYLGSYYRLRQEFLRVEEMMMRRIGQLEASPLRRAWAIHLRYSMMRFGNIA